MEKQHEHQWIHQLSSHHLGVHHLKLTPGQKIAKQTLREVGHDERSWGGGCFSGCCFTAGKTQQVHVNVYTDQQQWVPATVNLLELGPGRPPDRSNLNSINLQLS